MSSDTTSEPPVHRPDPMGSDAEEDNLSPLYPPELHSLHYQEQYPQFRRRGGHPPGRPRIATRSRRPLRGAVAIGGGHPPGWPRIATLPSGVPRPCRIAGGGHPPGWPRIATSPATARACSSTPGGGHPPGWPRIATPIQRGAPDRSPWWRPSSGVAEDRNIHSRGPTAMSPWGGGGHPPGWPRIATRTTRTPATTTGSVAAILRGGRGSQPVQFGGEILRAVGGGHPPGWPRIATGYMVGGPVAGAVAWRPSSGVAEDRNYPCKPGIFAATYEWRPSSGVAEDRNASSAAAVSASPSVAAILRGGRGSQHHQVLLLQEHHQVAAILRGGRGSQPVPLNPPSTRRAGVAAILRGGRGSQRALAVLHARLRDEVAAILRGGRGSQLCICLRLPAACLGWRPSSGVAEDRNTHSTTSYIDAPGGGHPPGWPRIATTPSPGSSAAATPVAAILRGGRGSQHRSHRDRRHSQLPGGGHPPGWPRIATISPATSMTCCPVAAILRGGRGSQRVPVRAGPPHPAGGGHPPGWPRIATPTAIPPAASPGVAAILRGGRGSQPVLDHRERGDADVAAILRGGRGSQRCPLADGCRAGHPVAAILRGGRGSQLPRVLSEQPGEFGWRPSSGAAEDRNSYATATLNGGTSKWRPSSGVAEDRNSFYHEGLQPALRKWRPSSGVAEDRNFYAGIPDGGTDAGWRPSSGVAEDRNDLTGNGAQRGFLWRPSSGVAEDRNPQLVLCDSHANAKVAAILRGGRGSQLRLHVYPVVGEVGGGHPPGWPRIATPSCTSPG